MFAQALESILADHCTPAVVRAVESGEPGRPRLAALGAAVAEAGFLELLADEADGGAGLGMDGFFEIAVLCGRHSVPLPLTQTMAARLLVREHAALPPGMISFAPGLTAQAGGRLLCAQLPFGLSSEHVIAQLGSQLHLLPVAQARCTPTGVHGSLVANLEWDAGAGRVLDTASSVDLNALGALLHAALLVGAMQRAFDITLAYGNDRVQFGKSIGKFQAIQHQLAVMAEQVAAASIGTQAAFDCARRVPSLMACAVAKSRASESAQRVAAMAHAVHGAIGVTAEYDLQLHTRRLHEWRMAHGSEAYWNRIIGRGLLASDAATIADHVRGITA